MKIKNDMLLFWGGMYSQWYSSEIVENSITFKHAEMYMMYHKAILFNDHEIAQQILKSNSPKDAKALGRKVRGFDVDVWNRHAIDIVTRGNYLKFTQNPELLETLLKHKDLELVEASPYDNIWGIGLAEDDPNAWDKDTWKGTNWLGISIMKARDKILLERKLVDTW